ncbi:hypothetical protein ACSX1A_11365 [Pontibacter sp. MBLB2868]|uniref:hypothetical protein n=1 Tax=Pontibacter sp. MBLB2868 TaxID=3451555 RepID=UPI003F74D3AF
MRYIAIVDKLPPDFSEGSYSRVNESNFVHSATSKLPISSLTKKGIENVVTVAKVATSPILAVPSFLKGKVESKALNKINEIEESFVSTAAEFLYNENYNSWFKTDSECLDWALGGISFNNASTKGNYSLEPKSLFSPIIDCVPNFSTDVLKKLMQSGGGSELIIVERNNVPKSFHLSGEFGVFDTGLYITHPKLSNKLIPLKNSVELIKDIILEEMITILTFLGAKRIVIKEAIGKKINTSFGFKGGTVGSSSDSNMETLRIKEFGESPIDLARARKAVLFTADLPKFKTIFQAREHSNQTLEVFEETVDFSANIDVSVIKAINPASISGSINLKKFWRMEIEFYDKNKLPQAIEEGNANWFKKLF